LFPGLRKGLAREAGAHYFVTWNRRNSHFSDVTIWRQTEIRSVDSLEFVVELACKNAVVPQLFKCQMEPAESRKQVDKPHKDTGSCKQNVRCEQWKFLNKNTSE
jgi:hypothetical protein